jgi:tetratricopeptide (TPR) repeat protein
VKTTLTIIALFCVALLSGCGKKEVSNTPAEEQENAERLEDKEEYDRAIADAIADYTEALRLNPTDATAYYIRGVIYADKGEYDRAIADYTEAIRLNPDYADPYNDRGIAYYYKRDYARTRADWEKALQINPNHAGARSNLEILQSERH